MSTLFREIKIRDFMEDEITLRRRRGAPAGLDLPKINPLDAMGAKVAPTQMPPPMSAPPAGAPPAGAPPMGAPQPGMEAGMPPQPGMEAGMPPMGEPGMEEEGMLPEEPLPVEDDGEADKMRDLLVTLKNMKTEIAILKNNESVKKVMESMEDKYDDLEEQIKIMKDRKVPSGEYFDTEGTYKEYLFGMVCEMLDEFLPELFEELPDYSFLSSQISRTHRDGTIADAMVSLYITVPKGRDRYDFKLEVPVLNGLIYRPLYIERGLRIIPLTKREVQRELSSMTYRKTNIKIETPYEKEQLFSNIGDNPHRRPDNQKVYNVRGNDFKQHSMPSQSTWNTNQLSDEKKHKREDYHN